MFPDFLHVIDLLGTFAFAVSGAFAAMEKKLDPFGILIISFATAIGGGTIRDLMAGNLPVMWLHNDRIILVIFITSVASMLFGTYIRRLTKTLFVFDALGLGLFTLTGMEIGLRFGFGSSVCIALGTITACFGGVVRDVLLNKVPLIFRREIYALACIAGGVLYMYLQQAGWRNDGAKIFCILLIFIIRIIAVRFNWSLPRISLK